MGWGTEDGFIIDNIVINYTPGAVYGGITGTSSLSGDASLYDGSIEGEISGTSTLSATASMVEMPIPSYTTSQSNNVVSFTDTSINSPNSWLWDFGDGATSSEQNPTHYYQYNNSDYNVTLFVSNSYGEDVATTPLGLESIMGARETNVDIVTKLNQIETCDLQYINLSTAQASANLGVGFPFFIVEDNKMLFTGFMKRVTKQDNKPVWDVHAEGTASYLRDKYTNVATTYYSTPATTIIDDLIGVGGVWVTDYASNLSVPDINYKITPNSVLAHVVNIVKMCGWDWDCYRQFTGPATNPSWGAFTFRVKNRMGSLTTVASLVNNQNIVNLQKQDNTDLVYTSVVANGTSASAANMYSIISANTFNMNELLSDESYLADTISSTATNITLIDSTDYPASGTIQIDNEQITYTGNATNQLTGCIRGANSTTAAVHNIGSDVLMITQINLNNGALYQGSSVWIGMEKIGFSTSGQATLSDLTRGEDGTLKYSHNGGVYVRDDYYSNTSPQEGTPVKLYGVRQKSISAGGVTDQNRLDILAQKSLYQTQTATVYGELTMRSPDRWTAPGTLGDTITIVDKDNNYYTTRLLGIHYNQFKPVSLWYGAIDEMILDDFANLATTTSNSMTKNDNTYKTSVTSVSTINSRLVYVKLPDGTSDWVEVV